MWEWWAEQVLFLNNLFFILLIPHPIFTILHAEL